MQSSGIVRFMQGLISCPRLASFLRERLDSKYYLGLPLTAGILTMAAAMVVFMLLARQTVDGDAFAATSMHIFEWLSDLKTPLLTDAMFNMSAMHGTKGMTVLVFIVVVVMAWKRYWIWLAILLMAVPPGAAINAMIKQVFERSRPQLDSPYLVLHDYSFPSGHTCSSTLFYGVLAAFLIAHTRSWRLRGLVCMSAFAIVAVIALSRIYLGAHFLSDVLAGFAEGIAWLAFCMTLIHTLVGYWQERKTR